MQWVEALNEAGHGTWSLLVYPGPWHNVWRDLLAACKSMQDIARIMKQAVILPSIKSLLPVFKEWIHRRWCGQPTSSLRHFEGRKLQFEFVSHQHYCSARSRKFSWWILSFRRKSLYLIYYEGSGDICLFPKDGVRLNLKDLRTRSNTPSLLAEHTLSTVYPQDTATAGWLMPICQNRQSPCQKLPLFLKKRGLPLAETHLESADKAPLPQLQRGRVEVEAGGSSSGRCWWIFRENIMWVRSVVTPSAEDCRTFPSLSPSPRFSEWKVWLLGGEAWGWLRSGWTVSVLSHISSQEPYLHILQQVQRLALP